MTLCFLWSLTMNPLLNWGNFFHRHRFNRFMPWDQNDVYESHKFLICFRGPCAKAVLEKRNVILFSVSPLSPGESFLG